MHKVMFYGAEPWVLEADVGFYFNLTFQNKQKVGQKSNRLDLEISREGTVILVGMTQMLQSFKVSTAAVVIHVHVQISFQMLCFSYLFIHFFIYF